MALRKSREVAEFGDFQTPDDLANKVVTLLKTLGVEPATIIEPSCGRGAFLEAAASAFPKARLAGFDINAEYLQHSAKRLAGHADLSLTLGSFFRQDWEGYIAQCARPLLVLGNPPWVTNAELGQLGSDNLPAKTNFQNHKGLDAVTGKSNFDISEWMLLENLKWLELEGGVLAVLCKTAVARKILASAWKRTAPIKDARIYRINALASFGAAVDACLFYLVVERVPALQKCAVYDSLDSSIPSSRFGFADGKVVSNVDDYLEHHHLFGINKDYTWRSGVKHDCSKVMEFDFADGALTNGYGSRVDIESTYLFPLFKSSDIGGAKQLDRRKYVLVTQRTVGEETESIREIAPKTWRYLLDHADALDRRTSVIYKNKARFSIFGVGDYTFAPWKIAISGLYKNLAFKLYGPVEGKPVCFDDTAYFLPFSIEEEARAALELLQMPAAQSFLKSMIFWDEKRPITVDVLKRLDMAKLARSAGRGEEIEGHRFHSKRQKTPDQLSLLG